jgi:hypothetical protein
MRKFTNRWFWSFISKRGVMICPRISTWCNMGFFGKWSSREDSTKDRYRKCLISIIWFANGVHSLLDVLKGRYLIVCFSQSIVLDLVRDIYEDWQKRMLKDYDMHSDNSHTYNSRLSIKCLAATTVRKVLHPAYSPDLTSSNFFHYICGDSEGTDFHDQLEF